jgi:hypothetical protein
VVKDKDMTEINDCSATKTPRDGICFHKTKCPEQTWRASFSLSEPENKNHLLPHLISSISFFQQQKNTTSLLLEPEVPLFSLSTPPPLF